MVREIETGFGRDYKALREAIRDKRIKPSSLFVGIVGGKVVCEGDDLDAIEQDGQRYRLEQDAEEVLRVFPRNMSL